MTFLDHHHPRCCRAPVDQQTVVFARVGVVVLKNNRKLRGPCDLRWAPTCSHCWCRPWAPVRDIPRPPPPALLSSTRGSTVSCFRAFRCCFEDRGFGSIFLPASITKKQPQNNRELRGPCDLRCPPHPCSHCWCRPWAPVRDIPRPPHTRATVEHPWINTQLLSCVPALLF